MSATYAIGDLHGCRATLDALLAELPIDWRRDRLFVVGDLVNRGPRSLAVLEWAHHTAQQLGERFVTVLGNHDLHLLAVETGVAAERPGDTLADVLASPRRVELCRWLRRRPLLHRARLHDDEDLLLVHAGLLPGWSLEEATRRAAAVERALRSPAGDALLRRGAARHSEFARDLSVMTRARMLDAAGEPSEYAGPPEQAPAGLWPWFSHPGCVARDATVLTGHWAALGLRVLPRLIALDSGCVWGGPLSAVRLEDRRVFQAAHRDGLGSERVRGTDGDQNVGRRRE